MMVLPLRPARLKNVPSRRHGAGSIVVDQPGSRGRAQRRSLTLNDFTLAELNVCITGDTLPSMADVTIRELRNKGGEVVERVIAGEVLTVTRDGLPVALLSPLPKRPITAEVLLERWRRLPPMDPNSLRHDLDQIIDPSL
jgi:prevent-host-death family protein